MGDSSTELLWVALKAIFAVFVLIMLIVAGVAIWGLVIDKDVQTKHLAQRIDFLICGNSPGGGCPADHPASNVFTISGDEEHGLLVFMQQGSVISVKVDRSIFHWAGDYQYTNPCDGACVCNHELKEPDVKKSSCEPLAVPHVIALREFGEDYEENEKGTVQLEFLSASEVVDAGSGLVPGTYTQVLIPYRIGQKNAFDKTKDIYVSLLYMEYQPSPDGRPPRLLITPYYEETHEERSRQVFV